MLRLLLGPLGLAAGSSARTSIGGVGVYIGCIGTVGLSAVGRIVSGCWVLVLLLPPVGWVPHSLSVVDWVPLLAAVGWEPRTTSANVMLLCRLLVDVIAESRYVRTYVPMCPTGRWNHMCSGNT